MQDWMECFFVFFRTINMHRLPTALAQGMEASEIDTMLVNGLATLLS